MKTLPKRNSRVDTVYGSNGIVLFVGASSFLVRYYDKGDYTVMVCDNWTYSA